MSMSVMVGLPGEHYTALNERARREGCTLDDMMGRCLDRYLAEPSHASLPFPVFTPRYIVHAGYQLDERRLAAMTRAFGDHMPPDRLPDFEHILRRAVAFFYAHRHDPAPATRDALRQKAAPRQFKLGKKGP